MFAIAFDLVVADTWKSQPKGVSQAYSEIAATLSHYAFKPVQGSLYVTENEDMANLFSAIQALKQKPWFPKSVRDIHTFRIEQWSDFTPLVKS
jgi:virulence-associated protein VapD